jgi:hypothetical protein
VGDAVGLVGRVVRWDGGLEDWRGGVDGGGLGGRGVAAVGEDGCFGGFLD